MCIPDVAQTYFRRLRAALQNELAAHVERCDRVFGTNRIALGGRDCPSLPLGVVINFFVRFRLGSIRY